MTAPRPEVLEGVVARVVFRAPDGGFAVLRLTVPDRDRPVAVVGAVGDVSEGESVRLEGSWERHSEHGDQFRASRAVAVAPRSSAGVERYLEGLGGIGPELARRLVAAFGAEALETIEREPWRAAQVRGVGKRRAERAARELAQRRQEREVMVFLQGIGVSPAFARRIRKAWGEDAIRRVRDNPYRLAHDVAGIGFGLADRIARGMGVRHDAPERIEAGLVHVLDSFVEEGHVFAPRPELLERAAEILGVDRSAAVSGLEQAADAGRVTLDEERVFPPRLRRAELETARRLVALTRGSRSRPPAPGPRGTLSDGQWRAVELASTAPVVVVTGGPGTGKTTIVRTLAASWGARGQVLLAAPTGRAARRLSETTGHPAQTIHRLLEWGRSESGAGFARNARLPLEADLIVIDEMSMVDLPLFDALVAAIAPGTTLVLVGDVDQLPSVGPGQVLADLIDSGVVPVARLVEVFRQAEGSGIVRAAYQVLAGEVPAEATSTLAASAESEAGAGRRPLRDFYVVHAEEPARARDIVVRLCRERIPSSFGLDPLRDVQVLTPMHRGAAGTEELNRLLQQALGPGQQGPALEGERGRIALGDKVMQVRNDYERDVFNGDVGFVARIDEEAGQLVVSFDGREVDYDEDQLDQLELAYAISVHKSQGSEYPAVVLVLATQHFVLLQRNLVYTALTRGRRLVVLVTSDRALEIAVRTEDSRRRHTALGEALRAAARTQAP